MKMLRGPVKFFTIALLVVFLFLTYTWIFRANRSEIIAKVNGEPVVFGPWQGEGNSIAAQLEGKDNKGITANTKFHQAPVGIPDRSVIDMNLKKSAELKNNLIDEMDDKAFGANDAEAREGLEDSNEFEEIDRQEHDVVHELNNGQKGYEKAHEDPCPINEDTWYTDPNAEILHAVCRLTVRDSKFKAQLSKMDRLVHLDLKGAAPKVSYLALLFPLIKAWGGTGLLIEYEDMFPYKEDLADLASGDAYSEQDIKKILSLAEANSLIVIPLVQTFGHLEFLLKHKEFMKLREIDDFPQAISPCKVGTMVVIQKMLSQVMALHDDIKYIHIGADEVYHLGMSKECNKTMQNEDITKDQLFITHVTDVANYIKKKWQWVQPIMWDDMFRHVKLDVLRSVSELIEPMIWSYTPEVPKYITDVILSRYSQAFEHVWIASSFKGATGSAQYITDISYHLRNHIVWLKLVHKFENEINFRGIALTGWQRYDHFATFCELLPQAVPSLAACLQTTVEGTFTADMLSKLTTNLGMNETLQLAIHNRPLHFVTCTFPGCDVYQGILQMRNISSLAQRFGDGQWISGWLTEYHMKHEYFSPGQLQYSISKIPKMLQGLNHIEKIMRKSLESIYSKDTIEEWIAVNIHTLEKKLKSYNGTISEILSRGKKYWQKRPLHSAENDQAVNENVINGINRQQQLARAVPNQYDQQYAGQQNEQAVNQVVENRQQELARGVPNQYKRGNVEQQHSDNLNSNQIIRQNNMNSKVQLQNRQMDDQNIRKENNASQ